MESVYVRHPAKDIWIPLRDRVELLDVVDQHTTKEDAGLDRIGTVQHLVGEDEFAEQDHERNEQDRECNGSEIR